ncbi:VWA domain-containing protein [Abyssibius alkaniclasticus]|uniref:vWA domain-containing protein n=1 Tax=Abyssibius alkaniclasticus TaxID=2881234 RepID=UPI002364A674|nr:VWA domain-containing protein [Abyssibius alkaniclasticus]UPH72608.1 VWA domain-containing protein [Abyssibius alkaniclasticus]
MSDEFDRLKDALKAAPPAPDAARRAENIAAALKNFDEAQENANAPRPTSDRPQGAGLMTGVFKMFNKLSANAALIGSTSVAALVIGIYIANPFQANNTLPDSPPRVDVAAEELARQGASPDITQPTTPAVDERVTTANAPAEAPTAPITEFDQPVVDTATDTDGRARTEAADGGDGYATAQATELADSTTLQRQAPASPVLGGVVAEAEAQDYAAAPAPRAAAPLASGMVMPVVTPSDMAIPRPENTEEFANESPNPVQVTLENPVSTFSADVDTASWAIARSSLMSGYLPGPDTVRIEEMVNYFPYDYAAPDAGEGPFRPSISVMQTPWNPDTRLVRIALQGEMPSVEDRPPLNLVFLIDTSGSMDSPDKLGLLRQSLKLMLGELRPEDRVAIVAYAGSAGQVLAPTAAADRATIMAALDRLSAGGSTAGQAGLQQAYAIAAGMMEEGEVARVLLATDGDFNVGISDPDALKDYIATQRDTGVYLSVLGFGRGNLDDATMQALAQNGNGQAAYIDTLVEAQKVLVDQLTGALFTIAGDVKLQVEWNPSMVAEYRLIGYETRALAREDFNNDRVDAGELGAGHSVTALYEITAPDSPALLNDPLRYATAAPANGSGELGFLRLRFKAPGEDVSQLIETPILLPEATTPPDADAQFAAAIAGFGQLLRDAKYLGDWGIDDAIALAIAGRGEDEFGYRAEAINLMRLAGSLLPK